VWAGGRCVARWVVWGSRNKKSKGVQKMRGVGASTARASAHGERMLISLASKKNTALAAARA
jgi:hypothetical protein